MKFIAFVFLGLGIFGIFQVISAAVSGFTLSPWFPISLLLGLAFWGAAAYFYRRATPRSQKPVLILSWMVSGVVLAMFIVQLVTADPLWVNLSNMMLWLFITGQAFASFYLAVSRQWQKPDRL